MKSRPVASPSGVLSVWGTVAIVAAVIALPTASTEAGLMPDLEVTLDLDDSGAAPLAAMGSDLGAGLWNFTGGQSTLETDLAFDINVSDDPSRPDTGAFVGSNFTVQNLSGQTQTYRLRVTLQLASIAADGIYAGSAGFGLTGTDGLLQTVQGSPLWEASVDGGPVASLFEAPMFLSFTGDGSASTSDDLAPSPLTLASDEISIDVRFQLSPGDTLIVTGAFAVIPGPAGLLVLAGPALAGRRRRRQG